MTNKKLNDLIDTYFSDMLEGDIEYGAKKVTPIRNKFKNKKQKI